MRYALPLTAFVIAQTALACPVGHSGPSKAEQEKIRKQIASHPHHFSKRKVASDLAIPVLPTADSNQPWGGSDKKKWQPESILANAVSGALNEGWAQPNVKDVLVSVPVKMTPTAFRPYGDGQTNATISFGKDWNSKEPQVVTTLLVLKGGRRIVKIWISPNVKLNEAKLTVTVTVPKRIDTPVTLEKGDKGYRGEWEVPAEITFGGIDAPRVAWLRPAGWTSSFPIDFRFPAYKNTELVKASKDAKSDGHSALDPMGIHDIAKKSNKSVQDLLIATPFNQNWKKNDHGGDFYPVANIHAEVPIGGDFNNMRPTAVGGGHTWLIPRGNDSAFKNLYTCFDERNYKAEQEKGVPSGGGWHEIGDAAETIINSVEQAPVVVGQSTGVPDQPPPDGTTFAWDLTDVVTVRFLMPGEAMMTGAGKTTWNEDRAGREVPGDAPDWKKSTRLADQSGFGRNYHWFIFQSDQPTCTEEWVHNCLPTSQNNFGLEAKSGPDCSPR